MTHRVNVDESDNTLVEEYAANVFENVDPQSLILTYQWDYLFSPSLYFQHVRKIRPDVFLIDKELLRRSWYLRQLERNAPWLIERCKPAVERFAKELHKFEHGLPLDGNVIEARFNEMINDFINKALHDRPVYLGPEIEAQFAPAYQRIPQGLLLRVSRPGDSVNVGHFRIPERFPRLDNSMTRGIRLHYSRMMGARAMWFAGQGNRERALEAVEQWLVLEPGFPPAVELRRQLTFSALRRP
jgi:hypothetical protein